MMQKQKNGLILKESLSLLFVCVLVWSINIALSSIVKDTFDGQMAIRIKFRRVMLEIPITFMQFFDAGRIPMEAMLQKRGFVPAQKYEQVYPWYRYDQRAEFDTIMFQLRNYTVNMKSYTYLFDDNFSSRFRIRQYKFKETRSVSTQQAAVDIFGALTMSHHIANQWIR